MIFIYNKWFHMNLSLILISLCIHLYWYSTEKKVSMFLLDQQFRTCLITRNHKQIRRQCDYHIIFIIVITTRMIYAPTLIILMYESFYLMKRCFCYLILKATCFVTTGHDEVKTWRQDDARVVKRYIQSLIYHPEFFAPFTKQLNWHYISWHIICSHFIENLNILLHTLRPL